MIGNDGVLIVKLKDRTMTYDVVFNNSIPILSEILKTVDDLNKNNEVLGYELKVDFKKEQNIE